MTFLVLVSALPHPICLGASSIFGSGRPKSGRDIASLSFSRKFVDQIKNEGRIKNVGGPLFSSAAAAAAASSIYNRQRIILFFSDAVFPCSPPPEIRNAYQQQHRVAPPHRSSLQKFPLDYFVEKKCVQRFTRKTRRLCKKILYPEFEDANQEWSRFFLSFPSPSLSSLGLTVFPLGKLKVELGLGTASSIFGAVSPVKTQARPFRYFLYFCLAHTAGDKTGMMSSQTSQTNIMGTCSIPKKTPRQQQWRWWWMTQLVASPKNTHAPA